MGHTKSRRKARGGTRRRERGDRDEQDERDYAPRNQSDDAMKYGGIAVACVAVVIGIIVATRGGGTKELPRVPAAVKPKPTVDPVPVEPPLPKDPMEALAVTVKRAMDAGDYQVAWKAVQKLRDKMGDGEGSDMARLDNHEQKIRTRAIEAFGKEAEKIRELNGTDHDAAVAAFTKLKARFAGPADDEIESLGSDISAPGGGGNSGEEPPERPGKSDPENDEPQGSD